MVKPDSPEVGMAVEVEFEDDGLTRHGLAKVLDETEKGLILSGPDSGGEVFLPKEDASLKVRYHRRDAGYQFDTIVLAVKKKPFPLLYVPRPTAIERRQLRAYLRVDCEIPVSMIRSDDRRRNAITGVITNISGGGLVAALMTTIPPNLVVELKFDLGEDGPSISGVTARILTIRPGESGTRLHVMQFEGIDDEQRTEIIRYTFRVQHEQQKKKKGEAGKEEPGE